MPRQNLREREEAIIVEELGLESGIKAATEHFKRRGLIVVNENTIREWEHEQARAIFQRVRKFRRRTKEIQLEMINLKRVNDDGTSEHYYKRYGDLNALELAIWLSYWRDRCDHGAKEFHYYYKPGKKKFGKELDQVLWFDIPPLPQAAEPKGATV